MKKFILTFILIFAVLTFTNIIVLNYYDFGININGPRIMRPNNEIINRTGYYTYKANDNTEIKIHHYLLIEPYKYIYIGLSHLMEG